MKTIQKRKLAISLIILLPTCCVGLAIWMYYSQIWTPHARTQKGILIWPTMTVTDLQLYQENGEPFQIDHLNKQWSLLILASAPCGQTCQEKFHITERLRIALNKDRDRLKRYAVHTTLTQTLLQIPKGVDDIQSIYCDAPILHSVLKKALPHYANIEALTFFIMDPHGNLMMAYTDQHPGQAILKDLQKLLRLSRIG
ncbi:MAG: hypothetical protein HAW62_03530 [Endozoicomonadaceae bacterium]|nr:hypothetical protein [Endozoicomonadaceae bacterium]